MLCSFLFVLAQIIVLQFSQIITTMAKKVVSVALHTKKPTKIKHNQSNTTRTKLKTIFKKIKKYMKSDTYVYSPFAYPKSSVSLPPVSIGEKSYEPLKKKENKWLLEEVEFYLKCDCYMYAPLLHNSASHGDDDPTLLKADASRHRERKEQRSEETIKLGGSGTTATPISSIAVTHILKQQETVKHVVHQNCVSSPVSGKVLMHKEPRKKNVPVEKVRSS